MMLSRDEVRAIDRRAIGEFGLPGVVLMENAGRGTAELLLALGISGSVLICCGKGNNGGDGFVIARHLHNHDVDVAVLLFAPAAALSPDAAIHHHVAVRAGIRISELSDSVPHWEVVQRQILGACWVVDALFGTGLQGGLRPPFDHLVKLINDGPAPVLAVDIPSGLDCDTGRPLGPTIRAAHTATIVAPKMGFSAPEAKAWLGHVHVLEIGVPRIVLQDSSALRTASTSSGS